LKITQLRAKERHSTIQPNLSLLFDLLASVGTGFSDDFKTSIKAYLFSKSIDAVLFLSET